MIIQSLGFGVFSKNYIEKRKGIFHFLDGSRICVNILPCDHINNITTLLIRFRKILTSTCMRSKRVYGKTSNDLTFSFTSYPNESLQLCLFKGTYTASTCPPLSFEPETINMRPLLYHWVRVTSPLAKLSKVLLATLFTLKVVYVMVDTINQFVWCGVHT